MTTPTRTLPSLLLVDDEFNVVRTWQLIFERSGYLVTTACSCAQALDRLHNGSRFDAVITDLNMEREDIGLEVARAAKSLRPAPIVIICTGYATVENTRHALDMHVDFLATKPVDMQEMLSALNRLLLLQQAKPPASVRQRPANGSAQRGAAAKDGD